jgi:hypothetical protein
MNSTEKPQGLDLVERNLLDLESLEQEALAFHLGASATRRNIEETIDSFIFDDSFPEVPCPDDTESGRG